MVMIFRSYLKYRQLSLRSEMYRAKIVSTTQGIMLPASQKGSASNCFLKFILSPTIKFEADPISSGCFT
jgi:hypothetical protein